MEKKKLTAWEKVEIARNPKRKPSLDYINEIFDSFIELHGDRNFRDDKAIVCGLAKKGTQNFTIIAEQKGRTTKENKVVKEICFRKLLEFYLKHTS